MEKSAEAFRTISEVSELLDTPAHVLRFWESRFSQVRPVKRAGGRRYYRPNDLALLGGIKKLLHVDGLTIRGVQKILKEQGIRHVAGLSTVDLTPSSEAVAPPEATRQKPGWPVAPSPDAAEAGDRLLPDPDDTGVAAPEGEAPMQVDAPTLPLGEPDNVHPFAAAGTDTPEAGTAPPRPPAAAMLRAMDALRAREKKSELQSVYLRLVDLRERLSRGAASSRN
jgi:DNA-binding transcriptional MerR regulator